MAAYLHDTCTWASGLQSRDRDCHKALDILDTLTCLHTHTHTSYGEELSSPDSLAKQKSLLCGQQTTATDSFTGRLLYTYCRSTTCIETTHMQENIPVSFTKALDDEIEAADVGRLVLLGRVSCGSSEIQICPF